MLFPSSARPPVSPLRRLALYAACAAIVGAGLLAPGLYQVDSVILENRVTRFR